MQIPHLLNSPRCPIGFRKLCFKISCLLAGGTTRLHSISASKWQWRPAYMRPDVSLQINFNALRRGETDNLVAGQCAQSKIRSSDLLQFYSKQQGRISRWGPEIELQKANNFLHLLNSYQKRTPKKGVGSEERTLQQEVLHDRVGKAAPLTVL